MWRTAELRWWWRDADARPLDDWLLRGVAPLTDYRTDLYVAHAELTDIGIKQRGQEDTEVKVLIDLPEISLPASMDGQAEVWVKSSGVPLSLETSETIGVGKARRMRILAFQEGGWAEVTSEDEAEEGVSLEVSDIEAAGGKWTSVCFEAFGPDDRILPLLQAAVTLLGPWPASTPEPHISGGYPIWLGHILGKDA